METSPVSGYAFRMESSKVLVVDDFEAFRQFVCSKLQETADFTVVGQAADGLEAVQKAHGLQPDVVLLDIGLPQLNGLEAAHQISIVAPNSKIIFVSQENDPDVIASALADGAHGYVVKSSANRELLMAIKAVVGVKMVKWSPESARNSANQHF